MEQTLSIQKMPAVLKNEKIRDIVQRESKRLLNYIRSRINSDLDAEDILQEVFYQFTRTLQVETIDNVVSWLFKVAGNKITDWYRKRKSLSLNDMNTVVGSEGKEGMVIRLEDILFDPSEDPDELFMRSTIWPLLSEALYELPAEQRRVFVMHELEDKSFKEISEITGVNINTLISRKHYAILYLRDRLQHLYSLFFSE